MDAHAEYAGILFSRFLCRQRQVSKTYRFASLAHQSIEDNAKFGAEDYADWSVGASYTWEKVNFGLICHATDIDDADCSSLCDRRVVASVGVSF